MNEDVHSVSPTLGFIIKTIDYNGFVYLLHISLSLDCVIASHITLLGSCHYPNLHFG